jgi:hypothetical protein
MNRHLIRRGAAGIAVVMAGIYFLIGIGVLTVVDQQPGDPSMLVFGAAAASAFLLGAILLIAFDRRILWILGAVLQLFVAWAYFSVAAERVPAFEVWGVTLRILQIPLFAALVWLALHHAATVAVRGA